ncbi:MAG: clan AA aspartic protease [Gammaproteobacteria bacterium]|nr:clan AA aspartic protease [Gammaproteobacteria bacterium]
MGLTTAKVELRNPRRPDLAPVTIDALADTGSDYLCIPEHVRRSLALEQADTKRVTLADGTSRAVPYVGPLQLRFGTRTSFVGAVVIGDQPLLGAIALQDMDLVVVPQTRQVIINPASPDIATGSARATPRRAVNVI